MQVIRTRRTALRAAAVAAKNIRKIAKYAILRAWKSPVSNEGNKYIRWSIVSKVRQDLHELHLHRVVFMVVVFRTRRPVVAALRNDKKNYLRQISADAGSKPLKDTWTAVKPLRRYSNAKKKSNEACAVSG